MTDVRRELLRRATNGEMAMTDEARAKFALDRPTAVVRKPSGGNKERPTKAPEQRIREFRTLKRTDPHVKRMVDMLVAYIVGPYQNVAPANVPYTDEGQTPEDIADFKKLIETSPTFTTELAKWVEYAIVDGTAFLEIVVEDGEIFKPKVVQTELVSIISDEFGNITGYEMENPGDDKPIPFGPYDLGILRFDRRPGQDFGGSLLESIQEPADMLRDMEIDLARFISTKAYPPIVWKLGSEDRIWSRSQMQDFLDELSDIEPDSMLAVRHDVEHTVAGATSTQSEAGMLNLDSTFNHLLMRMHAGIGIPPFLTGMPSDVNRNTSIAVMPAFDRQVQQYRAILREAIRYQVFVSILAGDSDPAEYREIPPDFEFGQHSSEEERLETEEAIRLFTMGFLTREAAAERMGIDPELEMPDEAELTEIIELLQNLASKGDEIQNPDGGRPTSDGSGVPSSEKAVKSRKNPERETPDSEPKRDVSSE